MLKFDQVTKQFLDDRPALDNINFNIEKGELVVITGPSGSGKTTLLKLLTKEYEPSAGEIYFGDQNLNNLKRSKIPFHRRQIGAVFQDYKLLPELNIWENIALALSIMGQSDQEIEEKVTDLLKLVGLTDKAFLFPHQLSGGEAQRVSIARALSTAPQLIFADEPTGNLDPDNSTIIAKLLKKINELGTTVLVTTHDPVVIKNLPGARRMHLEQGVLTDSQADKPPAKAKAKVEAQAEKVEAKVEKTGAATASTDSAPEKSVADQPVAAIKAQPAKKSWGFFGIFKHQPGVPEAKLVEAPAETTETIESPDPADNHLVEAEAPASDSAEPTAQPASHTEPKKSHPHSAAHKHPSHRTHKVKKD